MIIALLWKDDLMTTGSAVALIRFHSISHSALKVVLRGYDAADDGERY